MTSRQLNAGHARRAPGAWAVLVSLIALTGTVAAQSTDPDHPTPMAANEVTGRWPEGKATSFYYSFVAGPGRVMVMFDFVVDHDLLNVSGELTDEYGRGIGNLDDSMKRSELSYFATTKGLRLVGRYELKTRQKLVVRVSTEGEGDEVVPGKFKVRIDGDAVSLSRGGDAPAAGSTSGSATAAGNPANLPGSGRLRLVMDDGTVQEINLGRVREASIRP
jgi:hypothetical protein